VPGDDGRGRGSPHPGLTEQQTTPMAIRTTTTESIPDAYGIRRRTREHLADEHRRLRHARLADQLMPLSTYYATRWPRWRAA
jgi:hypothetical protein